MHIIFISGAKIQNFFFKKLSMLHTLFYILNYAKLYCLVFHFEGFDEVWAGHTDYQLAAMGDEFYIVHYKGSQKAQMVFSLKMYQYKEK